MHIIHFSAECYPAAKAGGLADVIGSLPKYLQKLNHKCEVVIPKYETTWIEDQEFETVFESSFMMESEEVHFSISKLDGDILGFPFYVIDIPGRFDRPGIYMDPWSGYAYWDELERFMSFQIAGLEWMKSREIKPDVFHCHDHHTGLIPFMLSQCNRYREMADIPTVFTVHNAEYHGEHNLDNYKLLPAFNIKNIGLLDWDGKLNSMAAGLKTAWRISTVSEQYMNELAEQSNGLEPLFKQERAKSTGIVNGIDTEEWDPQTDVMLAHNYSFRNRKSGKAKNKKFLCEHFGLDSEQPVISFIGRLVREKGADLLPDLIERVLQKTDQVNFVLLGTGNPELHDIFSEMSKKHVGYFDATLSYNEQLAHQIYAGSDFILMPSRVEPCGLNQMFAMRYGTVPIVRSVGGLKDTVKDISEPDGYGITFQDFSLEAAEEAVNRAINLYSDHKKHAETVRTAMKLDFSWKRSAQQYLNLYHSLTNNS